jgi:manganese transport protein
VISQVVLSFGLPFAIIPLIIFTSRRKVMNVLVNHTFTNIIATIMASLIILLNIYLLVQLFTGL